MKISVCCGGHGENNSSAFPGVVTSIVSFLIWACSVCAFVLVSAGRTFYIILLSCLPELLLQHVNTHIMQTPAHTATGITVHVHHTLESSLTQIKPGEKEVIKFFFFLILCRAASDQIYWPRILSLVNV